MTPTAVPEFASFYEQLESVESAELVQDDEGEVVTLSAQSMPLVAFARMLADRASVSVVVSARLDERPVSLEVADVSVGAVLALVARRLGVELTYSGGVYFIGELRPEDRGVYVRRVRRLDREGLTGAVETLLSQNGRMQAYDDGLVVVGDRVEVLHRVAELLDRVESAGADSWVVQVHMIATRESDLSEFGLDAVPALDVAATYATASNAADAGFNASLSSSLTAMLRAERTIESVELVTAPLFVMVDGGRATLADGDELRIPQFSISDFGTQTVTGFEIVQTGLDMSIGLRDLGDARARVEFRTSLSAVVGFVEDTLPTINTQRYETNAVIRSGGVYLLGALERRSRLDGVDGPFRSVERSEADDRTVMIWLRAYRIDGAAVLPSVSDAAD
ncbi:MAG: hypothetical protein AAGG01_00830 [Planctomycetota bacterium]